MDKQAILLVHAFRGQGGRDSIEQSYHLPFYMQRKKTSIPGTFGYHESRKTNE